MKKNIKNEYDKHSKHEDIYGMSRVGLINNTYEIYVNTDDTGNIPHFHYRDSADWDRFHTCISITSPEYFLHGTKQDILNSSQKKDLDQFMHSPVTLAKYKDLFTDNWELVCFLWDINNSSREISDNLVEPDYRLLK